MLTGPLNIDRSSSLALNMCMGSSSSKCTFVSSLFAALSSVEKWGV